MVQVYNLWPVAAPHLLLHPRTQGSRAKRMPKQTTKPVGPLAVVRCLQFATLLGHSRTCLSFRGSASASISINMSGAGVFLLFPLGSHLQMSADNRFVRSGVVNGKGAHVGANSTPKVKEKDISGFTSLVSCWYCEFPQQEEVLLLPSSCPHPHPPPCPDTVNFPNTRWLIAHVGKRCTEI